MSPPVKQPQGITVDRKINAGVLVSMLIGGVLFVNKMDNSVNLVDNSVHRLDETMKDVRAAIDRNTAQIARSDRATAVLESLVSGMERRIVELEKSVKR